MATHSGLVIVVLLACNGLPLIYSIYYMYGHLGMGYGVWGMGNCYTLLQHCAGTSLSPMAPKLASLNRESLKVKKLMTLKTIFFYLFIIIRPSLLLYFSSLPSTSPLPPSPLSPPVPSSPLTFPLPSNFFLSESSP